MYYCKCFHRLEYRFFSKCANRLEFEDTNRGSTKNIYTVNLYSFVCIVHECVRVCVCLLWQSRQTSIYLLKAHQLTTTIDGSFCYGSIMVSLFFDVPNGCILCAFVEFKEDTTKKMVVKWNEQNECIPNHSRMIRVHCVVVDLNAKMKFVNDAKA